MILKATNKSIMVHYKTKYIFKMGHKAKFIFGTSRGKKKKRDMNFFRNSKVPQAT